MKKYRLFVVALVVVLALAGCQKVDSPVTMKPNETRPTETEPVVVRDWMAGESPVPNNRIGVKRWGMIDSEAAVSPTGVYYLYQIMFVINQTPPSPMILYADHGSDTFIKLCGRPDCTHNTTDCNAYVDGGEHLSYHGGALYVISAGYEDGTMTQKCKLLRMAPDGTGRTEVYDFGKFAKEKGCAYAECDMITEGYCLFRTYNYVADSNGGTTADEQGKYYYKLDGSMAEPEELDANGWVLYNCGDVILTYHPAAENGGQHGSYWDWDPATDTLTYLTDHPGEAGWFGKTEGYYFKDGSVRRLTYATGEEQIVIQTDLEGNYYAYCFPDCIMLVSNEIRSTSDKNLYFYNWDFQPIGTATMEYSGSSLLSSAVLGETADKILLTESHIYPVPTHYISKAELGTEKVQVHEFDLTAIEEMLQTVQKFYPDAPW